MIDVEKLPRAPKYKMNAWIDYVELLCLANKDRAISKGDLLDRMRERKDLGESPEIEEDNQASKPDIDDRWQVTVDDWFAYLRSRSNMFGELYPFDFSEDGRCLLAKPNMDWKNKMYFYLLLASDTSRLTRSEANMVTSAFEFVCAKALRSYFPSPAEVYVFGSNATCTSPQYTGSIWNKIHQLAGDICETVKALETDFSIQNTGDEGLDLVGWLPTGDTIGGRLIAFGQCACTEEWVKKQHSSSRTAWVGKLTFTVPPSNFIFIPMSFRDTAGKWFCASEIHESILFDRFRILHFLRDHHNILDEAGLQQFINKALGFTESLF